MYKYFSDLEFKRCVPACSINDMNPEVLRFLDTMRIVLGFPIVINSAYRTKEFELSKGRSGTSSHCKGLAVDIRCTSPFKRNKILEYLFVNRSLLGTHIRIGIASTYLHVDFDKSKVESVWVY